MAWRIDDEVLRCVFSKKGASVTQGKVYLVGAGPGDPALLTLRGRDVIARAQVLVYDHLVSSGVLSWARADAEMVYVGKQAGRHSLPQEQINELLVREAQAGKCVVRLKGGDPFVFGRGGEEAEVLVAANVLFEVVPGVTAGVGAAAYAGIPVTHRDWASDVAFITGHEDASRPGPSQVDWQALGRWQGTLVFYMGVKNLPHIAKRLMDQGMAPDRPAAIIEWGTTARQRTVTGTLQTLAPLAQQAQIKPPSLVVVGEVVTLREKLAWFERRPLLGKRVVVTRARAQASGLAQRLTELGAQVLECPSIRIEPPTDDAPLCAAVDRVRQYHWIIFTSVNGVDRFFGALYQAGHDARTLSAAQLCAIGPATAARLRQHGLIAELVPTRYVAESILEAFEHTDDLKGKNILLPRAEKARAVLVEGLQRLGAVVDEVAAYRTVVEPHLGPALQAALDEGLDWVTFTSSSTVQNFLSRVDLQALRERTPRIASIGPVTSATIKAAGLDVDVEAAEYTIEALVKAIVGYEQ